MKHDAEVKHDAVRTSKYGSALNAVGPMATRQKHESLGMERKRSPFVETQD